MLRHNVCSSHCNWGLLLPMGRIARRDLCLCAQEFSHINSWLHHRLHGNRAAKCGLFAIAMIMVGHITEHFHQEHGQHDDQVKFKALEDRILELEESLRENEISKKPSTSQ